MKMTLKINKQKNPESDPFPRPHHSQLYIKGTRLSKVSVPFLKWSVFHGSSNPSQGWSAGQGQTLHSGPEQRRKTECTHHIPLIRLFFFFFVHHHTLHWLGWEFIQDARGRNLSSECCQTWQDADEWCICLMYLQRNKKTITWSFIFPPPVWN